MRSSPSLHRASASPLSAIATLALAGLLTATAVSCGKKGPPLAPLIRVPAAVEHLSARRLDDTVYLEFVVPSSNQDNSTPGDVSRVEVYGYTGVPDSNDEIVKDGTLVATVPVRRPPSPDEQERRASGQTRGAVPDAEPGFEQGAMVTVAEHLTPGALEVRTSRGSAPARRPAAKAVTGAEVAGAKVAAGVTDRASATAAGPKQAIPARFYVAVAANHKGRRGLISQRVGVPVSDSPLPPSDLKLTYTETQITLSWSASAARPAAADATAPAEPQAVTRDVPLGAGAGSAPASDEALSYNVYAVVPPGRTPDVAATGGRPAPLTSAPLPLNPAPLEHTTFADEKFEFGVERCYAVRTVRRVSGLQEESAPSAVGCVTPKDIFPPAAPKGLTAVSSAGVISLIWDPNTEPDLGGYLVLRGEATGGALEPITADPVRETTYSDTTVKPGVRYVYAVVALDKAAPPNISAQSNKVEETAR